MSAHAIAAEIRADLRAYRRRHRCGDQAVEHETKDAFCADLDAKIDRLVRAVGLPSLLSLRPGNRRLGTRSVQVVIRDRVPAKRVAARA